MNNPSENNSQQAPSFLVGNWHVVPATGQVTQGNQEIRLEPKAMDVLVYLAKRAGQAVTRMELEDTVWAGTVVSYDALSVVINKIRKALHDNPRKPEYIETLAKKGYRLIATVNWDETAVENPQTETLAIGRQTKRKFPSFVAFSLTVGILLTATTTLLFFTNSPESLVLEKQGPPVTSPEPTSIAVLPFANISGNARQDHFASGLTEYLITDLSRLSNLLVISRSSVADYHSDNANPADVSRDLGVRYVMTGNIRDNKEQVRVTAQLVDTNNNIQVWAGKFDRKLDDVITVQDELTRIIVSELAVEMTGQEEERFNRTKNNNFAAYELVLEGRKKHFQHTQESNKEAQELYSQAIEVDAEYARAYSALSVAMAVQFRRGWTDAPLLVLDRAQELAKKAIKLDDSLPQAYFALSYSLLYRQEFDKAAEVMDQGLAIAPSYADGYGLLSLIYNNMGKADKAIAVIKKAIKLNPYHTWDYPYNLGRAHYIKGQVKKAIPLLQEALERNENALFPRMFLAASFARNGQIDDAQWEVEQILVLSPDTTLGQISRQHSIQNPDLARAYLVDLRKAGIPE